MEAKERNPVQQSTKSDRTIGSPKKPFKELKRRHSQGEKPFIGTLDELLEINDYIADNEFIGHGYRMGYYKVKDQFKTLFMWHNETLNIWTHFMGAVFFVIMIIIIFCFYDSCMNVFNNTIEKLIASSVNDDVENKTALLSAFRNNLMKLVETAEHVPKLLLNGVIVQLNNVISLKDEIADFIFMIRTSIRPSDWVPQMAKYHQMVLDLEKGIVELYDTIDETLINYENVAFVRELAKIMPNRLMQQTLARWPICLYCMSAGICMGCSTAFHWFYPKNKRVFEILHKLDYSGIVILVFGSVVPLIYYSFYCNPKVAWFYIVLQFISCFTTFTLSMFEWFSTPQYHVFKGLVYAACGLFGGATCIHCGVYGMRSGMDSDAIPFLAAFKYFGSMGFVYLLGLVFYLNRIPESQFPNHKFTVFYSHVIWHVCVFLAALIHLFGLFELYEARTLVTCNMEST